MEPRACRSSSGWGVGVVCVLTLLVPSITAAQDNPFAIGTRVRVTVASSRREADPPRRVVGLVADVDAIAVSITPAKIANAARAMAIPKATIVRLERSAGRSSRWRGVALGALAGAGAGALLGYLSEVGCTPRGWFDCWPEMAALGGAVLGAGAGAAVGAALPPKERWVVVRF